jgi:hypothetical protein
MENNEMKIWSHAKKTDPSATKTNNDGGRKSTSISGYWMIQKATELFGPIGSRWGYEIIEERFDQGAPIINGDTGQVLCHTVTHTIKIGLFYPGSTAPVIQFGHTPYIYRANSGKFITDQEAPKKSLMDALKKSLSMLGFSADVFLGEFDDAEYVKERLGEEAIKKAENKEAEIERQKAEYKAEIQALFTTMQGAVSLADLEGVFRTAYRKMNRRGDETGIKKFTIEKDKIKSKLEKANG